MYKIKYPGRNFRQGLANVKNKMFLCCLYCNILANATSDILKCFLSLLSQATSDIPQGLYSLNFKYHKNENKSTFHRSFVCSSISIYILCKFKIFFRL